MPKRTQQALCLSRMDLESDLLPAGGVETALEGFSAMIMGSPNEVVTLRWSHVAGRPLIDGGDGVDVPKRDSCSQRGEGEATGWGLDCGHQAHQLSRRSPYQARQLSVQWCWQSTTR
jgi:hypothetical protein